MTTDMDLPLLQGSGSVGKSVCACVCLWRGASQGGADKWRATLSLWVCVCESVHVPVPLLGMLHNRSGRIKTFFKFLGAESQGQSKRHI